MVSLTFEHWRITVDREATRCAHAAMPRGGADHCDCGDCKNFAAHKPVAYPRPFLEVLERLGIDPAREIEVCAVPDEEGKGVKYYGWFYFVGTVESDPDAPSPWGEQITSDFVWYLENGQAFSVEQFEGLPVSQVLFFNLGLK